MDVVMFQNLLSSVVLMIFGLLAFAARQLISVGIQYLETRIGSTNTDLLKGFVQTTVRFLDQSGVFQELTGPQKKEQAILYILEYSAKHKLPIDRELIDKLIEEAVQVMNAERGVLEIDDLEIVGG